MPWTTQSFPHAFDSSLQSLEKVFFLLVLLPHCPVVLFISPQFLSYCVIFSTYLTYSYVRSWCITFQACLSLFAILLPLDLQSMNDYFFCCLTNSIKTSKGKISACTSPWVTVPNRNNVCFIITIIIIWRLFFIFVRWAQNQLGVHHLSHKHLAVDPSGRAI